LASTEPHCEHIVFTGAFCAADALTPAKEEHLQNTRYGQVQISGIVWTMTKR
jgi:hypothetical protein